MKSRCCTHTPLYRLHAEAARYLSGSGTAMKGREYTTLKTSDTTNTERSRSRNQYHGSSPRLHNKPRIGSPTSTAVRSNRNRPRRRGSVAVRRHRRQAYLRWATLESKTVRGCPLEDGGMSVPVPGRMRRPTLSFCCLDLKVCPRVMETRL